jgi:hypothetical protein
MTSRISHTSFDARNAYAQSVFWPQVLDFVEDLDDPNAPGHEEYLITSRDQSQLPAWSGPAHVAPAGYGPGTLSAEVDGTGQDGVHGQGAGAFVFRRARREPTGRG